MLRRPAPTDIVDAGGAGCRLQFGGVRTDTSRQQKRSRSISRTGDTVPGIIAAPRSLESASTQSFHGSEELLVNSVPHDRGGMAVDGPLGFCRRSVGGERHSHRKTRSHKPDDGLACSYSFQCRARGHGRCRRRNVSVGTPCA